MNEPSTSDQTNHRFAEAVRDFAPTMPRKWQKLLALKTGIAELRRKGASYQTITDILRAADVPVSRTTVARFCRERTCSFTLLYSAMSSACPAVPKHSLVSTTTHFTTAARLTTGPRGPRIADPNTI